MKAGSPSNPNMQVGCWCADDELFYLTTRLHDRLRSARVLDELDGDERHETCASIIAGTFRELAGPRSDRLLELAGTDLTSLLDQDGDSELRPSILLPPGHPAATEHRCVVCRPSLVPSASSNNAGSSPGTWKRRGLGPEQALHQPRKPLPNREPQQQTRRGGRRHGQ